MGKINRKYGISLSTFYLKYFLYIFIGILLWVSFVFLSFLLLLSKNVLYPANYGENQARAVYEDIQRADQVREDLIPDLCEYAVFDEKGNYLGGSLSDRDAQNAWKAVSGETHMGGKYSYIQIPRSDEICILRYVLVPQYKSAFLREHVLNPQMLLLLLAIMGIFFIIFFVAVHFGKALNKYLSRLIEVSNRVEKQELDFTVKYSGIREIDEVLGAMDKMRFALKESLEDQWEMEQKKNRQMSALAHDLKTPLTLVRGNAELLLESEFAEEEKRELECIARSALQMQNYVHTLIEVTKSNLGYQLHLQKIPCDSFFQEIKQQLEGLCKIHKLCFEWVCNCTAKEIEVDRELLVRAIVNVISNAADRTPEEKTVRCSIKEKEGKIHVVVEDEGSGFSKEALKHGREQFFMDDSSRNSNTHFGIGLYSASTIVQGHGGTLILENSPETGGAVVTVAVPY